MFVMVPIAETVPCFERRFFSCLSSISWFPLFPLFDPSPDQPMPANHEPALGQPLFPPLAGADRGRVVEQAVLLFLPGQPGEPDHERVTRRKDRLLAVEDGGIGALRA